MHKKKKILYAILFLCGVGGGEPKCTSGGKIDTSNFSMIGLNGNAIKNLDGSSYEPAEVPVNIHKGSSFDPESVPKPNYSIMPISIPMKLLGVVFNPFGEKFDYKELFPPKEEVDIIPITW